jgi:hypothetical protein
MQVSNYFVLADKNFEIADGAIKRFTAKMPTSNHFVRSTARPVLSFNVQQLSDDLKFIVLLNDPTGDPNNIPESKIVLTYEASGSKHQVVRAINEVLDGNDFVAGDDNLIDFRVIFGKVRFADVLLFFRVET